MARTTKAGGRDAKNRLAARLVFAWGSSLGFVVGAALAALLYRRLGLWPESAARLEKTAAGKAG